jgi:septum formation protein
MGKTLPFRLILASSSPARRDLLTRAGYPFDVQPSHIDEPRGEDCTDPRAFVQQVAWLKAAAVAEQVGAGVVLAADTVAWCEGQIIGKPNDADDARRILNLLGGREHELWTGVCLWRRPGDLQTIWQEKTRVFFRALTVPELETYLATRLWQNNSGAYAIEEEDDPYVSVVEGSRSNVIGLPMEALQKVLDQLAVAWPG